MSAGRGNFDRNGRPQTHTAQIAELTNRLENMVQYGVVEEADYAKNRYRVRTSPTRVTGWMPMSGVMADAGAVGSAPLKAGAQVAIMSPSGDQAQGFIVPGVYRDEHNRYDESGDEYGVKYKDGSHIGFNPETKSYDVSIPTGKANVSVGGASMVMTDDAILFTVGGVTFKMSGAGFEQVGGMQTHNGTDVGDTHLHTGVMAGPSLTGVPA